MLALLLLSGCGDHDGTFSGAFEGGVTNADVSAFDADEVNLLQYKLEFCSGGFLSSRSRCRLTYWENKDASKKSDVKERQLVFRMTGYPEEGLAFPIDSTDGGVSVSIELIEFPARKLSEDEQPPDWDAKSGTVITESVTDKGFKYRVVDVEFDDGFRLNGSGEVYAPEPPKNPAE